MTATERFENACLDYIAGKATSPDISKYIKLLNQLERLGQKGCIDRITKALMITIKFRQISRSFSSIH